MPGVRWTIMVEHSPRTRPRLAGGGRSPAMIATRSATTSASDSRPGDEGPWEFTVEAADGQPSPRSRAPAGQGGPPARTSCEPDPRSRRSRRRVPRSRPSRHSGCGRGEGPIHSRVSSPPHDRRSQRSPVSREFEPARRRRRGGRQGKDCPPVPGVAAWTGLLLGHDPLEQRLCWPDLWPSLTEPGTQRLTQRFVPGTSLLTARTRPGVNASGLLALGKSLRRGLNLRQERTSSR